MRLYISKYALKTGKDIQYIYYVLLSISLKKNKEMLQKGKFPNAPSFQFLFKESNSMGTASFFGGVTRHEKWVSVQPHNFYLSYIYYQKNVHK